MKVVVSCYVKTEGRCSKSNQVKLAADILTYLAPVEVCLVSLVSLLFLLERHWPLSEPISI